MPPYLTSSETEIIAREAKSFDGIYCDGYFGQELAKALGLRFFAGTGLNLSNRIALKGCVADYVCISKELTVAEARRLSAENSFYLTAGNIKVMDIIYCPFGKRCADCDQRRVYVLTDENNRRFPLRRYKMGECRFELYNCADLISEGRVGGRLIDLSLEDKHNISAALKCKNLAEFKDIFKNYTRGHSNSRIL